MVKAPKVTIGFVDQQESEQLYKLLIELGYSPDLESLPDMLYKLNLSDTDYLLAAYDEGKMIGWLHAVIMQRVTIGRYVEIVSLVVSEETRRQGIGKALIENAVNWGVSNGLSRIRVRSQNHREGAHQFYLDMGFEVSKEQKVFDKLVIED